MDEEVAKSITEGTYDIPTGLENVTNLILEKIGKKGMKIGNKEGQK